MTDNYKNTLNLPKTDFPMKANLAQREPEMAKRWEALDIYHHLQTQRAEAPVFMLCDGPPYANGAIHLGHAVNKTLKDIVLKSKLMAGYRVPYVPGWDCHGLPIELNVEKKIGKAGDKVSSKAFRQACRDYANSQIELQKTAFKRLGIFGDWDNPYLTMNARFEANIIRSLATIIDNHHLQRGYKPVHWCFKCASALAEAEVEYRDKESPSIDVCFDVVDREDLLSRFNGDFDNIVANCAVVIWTTTPWTLPANQAVAVHEDVNYVLLTFDQRVIIIAEPLVGAVMMRCGIEKYTVLGHSLGERLVGLQLHHPFLDRQVPVLAGDHVTVDSGTGCVHTAPAHGLEDYALGIAHDLPLDTPLNDRGCFAADMPEIEGLHLNAANPVIIDLLRQHDHLLHEEKLLHSYPHCWRHKTPLIYRATPQWFISMEKNHLLDHATHEVEQVRWIPENGKHRMMAMLEDRPDWCISRQRTWGVPLPLFLHKDTDELHPDTTALMAKIADLVAEDGIEAWHDLDTRALLGDDADNYKKCSDVLDVWFDSGVIHACVLKARKELVFPADLFLEGSDQHRGWFQTSLLTSCAMYHVAPYRQVLTHGFTVDAEGRKMSKSLGNVIAPDKLIKTMGADVLRLWIASTDYQREMVVSEAILKHSSETYRRIRNTARFLLANLNDFAVDKHLLPLDKLLALDHWAIERARQLQTNVQQAYDNYQFHVLVQAIHHFCSIEMGSFYLDIIKDRQYTAKTDGQARRSAQTAMWHIMEVLVRLLAPICPYTADEIWQHMSGEREASVFLSTWYELPAEQAMSISADNWQTVMNVRDAVNKEIERLRADKHLGSNLEATVTLYADDDLKACLDQFKDELRFVLIVSEAQVLPLNKAEAGRVSSDVDGLTIKITPSRYQKCARCWQYRPDVGSHADHPQLCRRCICNCFEQGEVRHYA
ncbi:MAG: isoleucine--tRNA ligase [Pseudomonadota bacterium]